MGSVYFFTIFKKLWILTSSVSIVLISSRSSFTEFVEKIIVHAPDRSSGQRVQQIDVHYNFIGEIDLSPEYIKTNT